MPGVSEENRGFSNRALFEELLRSGEIRCVRGPILEQTPPPLSADFDFAKVEGMLLGVAIGDSLGIQTEGELPGQRFDVHGEIRDYLPNRDGQPIGEPSDDTQLTFWTLEQLLEDSRLIPENVAKRFARDRIYGIGNTVRKFLSNRKSGLPRQKCGVHSAGNGALMRISPMLIPHLMKPSSDLWVDTVLCSMITHNDTSSIASCVAFVKILWDLLSMRKPPEPAWWLDTYMDVCSQLEDKTQYSPQKKDLDFNGPISQFVDHYVRAAFGSNQSVLEACNTWYSGAYLLETVPSVLYVLMKHSHDPEEAIVRAVNDTKDNDTIASIVGAAVGALHGRSALPERWITNLSGRTTVDDDGKVFELIKHARQRWSDSQMA